MAWCLGLQLKQFAILIAPFFLAEVLEIPSSDRAARIRATGHLLLGLMLAWIPFIPFYLSSPNLWLLPRMVQEGQYNPFHWFFWDPQRFGWNPPWLIRWNAVVSYSTIGLAIGYAMVRPSAVRLLRVAPIIGFWALVKSLHWAQFWYVVLLPALLMALKADRRVVCALLVLVWLQCGRSLALLSGHQFGVREKQVTLERFNRCIWRCNYQQR